MRTLIILIFIFKISQSIFGQIATNTESSDSLNIYNNAMKIYCDSLIAKNCNFLMVEFETLTTSHLPVKIGNVEIELIEYNKLIKLISKRNSLKLIRVIPVRFEKGYFFVNILQYCVTRKGKKLEYSLQSGMGAKVKYLYDCDAGGFVFSEIE